MVVALSLSTYYFSARLINDLEFIKAQQSAVARRFAADSGVAYAAALGLPDAEAYAAAFGLPNAEAYAAAYRRSIYVVSNSGPDEGANVMADEKVNEEGLLMPN